MRIKHSLCDFVLAIEGQLRSSLHVDTENVDQAIRLIHVPLMHATVGGQKQFRFGRGPVYRCHRSVDILLLSEHEFFLQFTTALQPLVVLPFLLFSKEVLHEIKLCAEGALYQSRRV